MSEVFPHIYIIHAYKNQGKSTFLLKMAEKLKQSKKIGGFLTVKSSQPDVSYELMLLPEFEAIPLIGERFSTRNMKFKNHFFNLKALEQGVLHLSEMQIQNTDLLIVDEVGPLEHSKRGWHSALETLVKVYRKPMIWSVRTLYINKIQELFGFQAVKVFDLNQEDYLEMSNFLPKE